jgi:hypothetical protein
MLQPAAKVLQITFFTTLLPILMVTPNPAADSGRPSGIEDAKIPSTGGPVTNQNADLDPNASGNPETVTQSDLANSDGAGIRGDYGDSDQTTGLEGGEQTPADTTPDRADENPTNAAQEGASGV